jgi:hypothetical protein
LTIILNIRLVDFEHMMLYHPLYLIDVFKINVKKLSLKFTGNRP